MSTPVPHTSYDIPALDEEGRPVSLRLGVYGPAVVTLQAISSDAVSLAKFHVSIVNTGALLTYMSACDRAARRWPVPVEPISTDGDGDAV